MTNTVETLTQSMLHEAHSRGYELSEQQAREDAENYTEVPEGYTRLSPTTLPQLQRPFTALSVPFIYEKDEAAATITPHKEYEIRDIDPLIGMLTGFIAEFTDDDGDGAAIGGFNSYGWAVKHEELPQ